MKFGSWGRSLGQRSGGAGLGSGGDGLEQGGSAGEMGFGVAPEAGARLVIIDGGEGRTEVSSRCY